MLKVLRKLPSYLLIIAYWVVSLMFITLATTLVVKGVLSNLDVTITDQNRFIFDYVISNIQVVESMLFGTFLGILFIVINELTEVMHWDKLSFGRALLLKSLLYILGMIIIMMLMYFILTGTGLVDPDIYERREISESFQGLFIVMMSYVVFNIIILNFIIQSIQKTGQQNLISFLTGKYHNPAIEDRIFMFLDLKSSTSYAERLGSIQYSKMIRDCFHDINHVVEDYDAQIYQYVGDEIVLTWEWNKHQNSTKFIELYFAFMDKINKGKDEYHDKYGILPVFKASLHGGQVTVAEIGNIKRDIAFHGDVLNTTSRIQELCNVLREPLLISSALYDRLSAKGNYSFKNLGEHLLRGKARKVGVYAISK